MSHLCKVCGRELTADEIAVTKKLINRGATEFMCVPCLARHFEVKEADIEERIRHFRQMGCTLFENAQMMLDLGAETAFHVDGGGSSNLSIYDSDGQIKTINRPCEGRKVFDTLILVRRPDHN